MVIFSSGAEFQVQAFGPRSTAAKIVGSISSGGNSRLFDVLIVVIPRNSG